MESLANLLADIERVATTTTGLIRANSILPRGWMLIDVVAYRKRQRLRFLRAQAKRKGRPGWKCRGNYR